ncbi:MAG TPA: Maf family protein [Stellaceae bacterium]|nr:Maf family protein [Stellaceae bacterium]
MTGFSALPLVLASSSRTRARLLQEAGLAVTCDPAAIDEAAMKARCRAEGKDAAACAASLADAKAACVAERHEGVLVIGADQLLVSGEDWFDKPQDRVAARRQLLRLRGKPHELVTAIAVWRDNRPMWRHVERPRLLMRDFSDDFLDAYLAASGDGILASVGAYQLEHLGTQLFERIDGDYFSILGLPLLPLLGFLRAAGAVCR